MASCTQLETKKSKMQAAKIVEVVQWKSKAGISTTDAKAAIITLNNFIKEQPGFVSRRTALAEDGTFVDIVYWTDIDLAKIASKKAMQSEICIPVFGIMDEEQMTFQYFELFNSFEQ